jgi:hypothetical protein
MCWTLAIFELDADTCTCVAHLPRERRGAGVQVFTQIHADKNLKIRVRSLRESAS